MTTFAQAVSIIRARFEANWSQADIFVKWENEDNTLPDNPAPYLYIEIQGDGEDIAAYGGGRGRNEWRNDGEILIHVLVPIGEGTTQADSLLEDALAIFRGERLNGVSYGAGSRFGDGGTADDGNYWRLSGQVPFHFYRTA